MVAYFQNLALILQQKTTPQKKRESSTSVSIADYPGGLLKTALYLSSPTKNFHGSGYNSNQYEERWCSQDHSVREINKGLEETGLAIKGAETP